MHKWQQKQRQRVHDSKIQNAKSSLQKLSKSRQKPLYVSRSKLVLPSTPYQTQIPVMRILQIFSLKQYSGLLQLYGFPQRCANKQFILDIQEIISKVQNKDKGNFYSMISTILAMSKKVLRQVKGKSDIKRKSILSRSQKTHFPPQSLSNKVELTNKPDKTTEKKKQKPNHESFRIRSKLHPTLHHSIQRKTTKDKKQIIMKPFIKGKKGDGSSTDDLCIIHNYRKNEKGVPTLINNSNSIIRRLNEKLTKKQITQANVKETLNINFDLKKIQQLYLSYDSATLTSNILNIDVEQTINCMSKLILQILSEENITQQTQLTNQNMNIIEELLRESFIGQTQKQNKKQTENQEQIQDINQQTKSKGDNQYQKDFDEQSLQNQNQSKSSDGWQYDADFYSSMITDFSCFDNKFQHSILLQKAKHDDIKNFIQLVMMAGKMEKEVPIIANVYLNRLLKKVPHSKMTNSNWRNLVLVTFIEASKIWDDQSLQNHSFAKVIKPYTTLEINRLQKYLLAYLDYQLAINQREYSQSYFMLRKHANSSAKTCHLLKLDLKTIKKLQSGSKKNQVKLKDFYQKSMNKSF